MKPAAPVIQNTKSRVSSIDGLRGFALLLVLITHFVGPFPGYTLLFTEEQLAALPMPDLDALLDRLNQLLFNDKARALFSFLFGLSFYFQLNKAERLGISFKKNFTRRLIILLVFGLLHAYLLWWGDILRWYFVAGIVLLFSYHLSPRVILLMGILCMFAIPIAENIAEPLMARSPERFISLAAARNGFLSDSYFEMLKANLLWDLNMSLNPWYRIPHTINILGFFFLGLWAGKTSIFKKVDEYGKHFMLGLVISFFVFLLGTYVYLYVPADITNHEVFSRLIRATGGRLNDVGLFVFYVCGFALLFHFTKVRYLLTAFIPIGQMTLTNYIMQSVAGIFLFHGIGLGLMTKVGPSVTMPVALVFFALQIGFSLLWLKYFTMGPLEWLWRALVAGKFQPLLKKKTEPIYS